MKRGRKARVSRETWSRVFIVRGPLLLKKNVIRELWMICLSWHVEAKSYFSWIVKLDQKSALFSVKMDLPCKRICKKDLFGCSEITWVKYVTDLIENNTNSHFEDLWDLWWQKPTQRYHHSWHCSSHVCYMQSFWSRSRQSVSYYHYGEKQTHLCDRECPLLRGS